MSLTAFLQDDSTCTATALAYDGSALLASEATTNLYVYLRYMLVIQDPKYRTFHDRDRNRFLVPG
jgi:hypothetical protein